MNDIVVESATRFREKRYEDLAKELAQVYVDGGFDSLGSAVRKYVEAGRVEEEELPSLRPHIRQILSDMGYEVNVEEEHE